MNQNALAEAARRQRLENEVRARARHIESGMNPNALRRAAEEQRLENQAFRRGSLMRQNGRGRKTRKNKKQNRRRTRK
jgi:hypothetical protein